MRWLLVGYMWLFVHRPFEIWPAVGAFRLELIYALFAGAIWLMYPDKRWLPNPLQKAFCAFLVAILLCWAVSPWASQGLDFLDRYFKMLFFYLLLVTVVREEGGLRFLVQAFLIIMAVYMLHSVREYLGGRNAFNMGIVRLIGVDVTTGDANAFGSTLVFALALVPAAWAGNRSLRWRAFLVWYACFTVACVGLTGSRGSFVILLVCVLMTVARSRLRWAFAALGLLATPFLWAALPPELQTRFETIIDPKVGPESAQASAEGRLLGLQIGLQLFEQFPLTGCGPGLWRPATGSGLEAHNLYGQVLGELGLLGTIPFACIVLVFWLNARRIKRTYREHPHWEHDFLYHLARCVETALVLLLINGYSGHVLYRHHWYWYGGFLIIACHCVQRRAQAEAEADYEPAETEGDWEEDGLHPRWGTVS
jgi:O-antigen ligase